VHRHYSRFKNMTRILPKEELRHAFESYSKSGNLTIQGFGLVYAASVRGGIEKIDALREMKKQSRETSALLDHFFDFSDVFELQNLSAEIGVEIEYDMLSKSCYEAITKALIDA
jgi:hypothetical protein